MLRIHQTIVGGEHPNASQLARLLEVATKTVHRDIEFMRDRLGLPLEYDARQNGYRYTEEVSAFPSFQITEGELFALLVAEKALQQYRGTNFEKPLVSAFKKIADSLPDAVSFNFADWDQTISFRLTAEPIINLKTFDALAKAAAQCTQLKLAYRKPGSKGTEERVIDPYHLANINGEWFLFAYDHLRKDFRKFVPARVQSFEPTGKTFERTKKFSLEKMLRDSFGVHSPEGEFDVILRFTSRVADYVREKRWHPSQELVELKDGVELRLKLSSLAEVERWVLSWGGDAAVIKPKELAERVQSAAKSILSKKD